LNEKQRRLYGAIVLLPLLQADELRLGEPLLPHALRLTPSFGER
jgi:hypothetical protein